MTLAGKTTANIPSPPLLLIGKGKLAQHMQTYCKLMNAPFLWHKDARSLNDDFSALCQTEVGRLRPTMAWILVSDRAVPLVTRGVRALAPHLKLFHASGALKVEGATALHPLFTFGPDPYPLQIYQSFPLTLIGRRWADEEILLQFCSTYFSKNQRLEFHEDHQAFYHALCVMVSNFPQILWDMSGTALQDKTGVNRTVFTPIILQAAANFAQSADRALTGPLARGDQETITKNLSALGETPLRGLYEAFLKSYSKPSEDT